MFDNVVLELDPAIGEHDPVHLGPSTGVEVDELNLGSHVDAWLFSTLGQDDCDAVGGEDEYMRAKPSQRSCVKDA